MTRITASLLPAALLCFVPPAPAQDAKAAKVAREMTFIRELARTWGFMDLAKAELDKVQQSVQSDPESERYVAQAACEILLVGAQRIPDRDKQKETLKEALERFEDFIAKYSNHAVAVEARVNLAEACSLLGRFLVEDMEETKDPDKVGILRDEAGRVFEKGVNACRDAMLALESRKDDGSPDAVKYAVTWLNKGILLREWARAVPKDREFQINRAREELETLILKYGEETPIGAKALLEYAACQEIQGSKAEAARTYKDSVDSIFSTLVDKEREVPESVAETLATIMEQGYELYTKAQLEEGNGDLVLAAIDEYHDRLKKIGDAKPDFRYGHGTMMNGVIALRETGDPANAAKALKIARDISAEHGNDGIAVRANNEIKLILSTMQVASPDDLFRAAFGDWQAEKLDDAIRSFKRVVSSVSTPEEAANFGVRSYEYMGRCFGVQKRYLEAYYAFKEAVDVLARSGIQLDEKKDAEIADALNRSVDGMSRAVSFLRGGAKDKFFEKLAEEARDYARKSGTGTTKDAALNKDALAAFNDKKYEQAIELYKQIGTDSALYEVALVRQGVALYRMKKFDEARKLFERYLNEYLADPTHKDIPVDDLRRQAYRSQAMAEASFYPGLMYYDEARDAGIEGDPSEKYKRVVEVLRPFPDAFPTADKDLRSLAYYYVCKSHLWLEEYDKAQEVYRAMKKAFPDDSKVANLALSIYQSQEQSIKALELELSKAPPEKKKELEDRLTATIQSALKFALEYVEAEATPQYALLRSATGLADRVRDISVGVRLSELAVQKYGDKPEHKDKVDRFVKPDLARFLVEKREFKRALPLVDDAIKSVAEASQYPLKELKARILGGWIEIGPEGAPVKVLGLEQFADAYKIYWDDWRKFVESKYLPYSVEWYEFYLGCTYYTGMAATRPGADASALLKLSQTCFNIARSTDDFDRLKSYGPRGVQMLRLFEAAKPKQ